MDVARYALSIGFFHLSFIDSLSFFKKGLCHD